MTLPGASCVPPHETAMPFPIGRRRTTAALRATLLGAIACAVACAAACSARSPAATSSAATSPAIRTSSGEPGVEPAPLRGSRPPDGLLDAASLQRIVDLQERRDAAGLRDALGSTDPAVRARAAFALGSVQDSAAAPGLLSLLDDTAAAVRADAAFALGQSVKPGSRAAGAAAAVMLDALAREPDAAVRTELLQAVGKMGDVASLSRLSGLTLPAGDRAARDLAIARYGIRGVHDAAALGLVARDLFDADPAVRLNAAYLFGRVRDTTAWSAEAARVRAALDALAPGDTAAMHLLLGVGRLADPEDTPLLIRWLREATDWRIAVNAARALGGRAGVDSAAADALVRALERALSPGGAWTHVAIAAAGAIGSAAGPATPAGATAPGDSTAGARPDPELVRRTAAWVRAHPDRWRVVAPLLPLLARGGETQVVAGYGAGLPTPARVAALAALGLASDPASLDALRVAAAGGDAELAAAAVAGIAARAPSDAFRVLAASLRRPDVAVQVAAAGALADSAYLGAGAVDTLLSVRATLRMPEELEARQAIDAALATLGAPVPAPAPHGEVKEAVDWEALRRLGPYPELVLQTEKGTVTLVLDAEEAPLTVQTIAAFADSGRYDGVSFHRVVPNFVIQGGDFARGDGFGGPGWSIPSEFTRIRYATGTLGMASAGKDTEGSQFFITHSMQPHLDGGYTAFGRVTSGQDVVDRILEGDRILRARIRPDSDAAGSAGSRGGLEGMNDAPLR